MGERLLKALMLCSGLWSAVAVAGDAFLTLSGTGCCQGAGRVQLTRAEFEALPQHELKTETPWTEGTHVYRGVLLRDLIARFSLPGETLKAVAVNDYWAAVPVNDALKYPVLLASRQDGQPLTLRSKGPLWIVYPLSAHPELDKELYHSRMVWQLTRLESH